MQMQHTNVLTLDNCTVLVKPVRDEGIGIVTNKSFERAISREQNGAQFKGQFTQKNHRSCYIGFKIGPNA